MKIYVIKSNHADGSVHNLFAYKNKKRAEEKLNEIQRGWEISMYTLEEIELY